MLSVMTLFGVMVGGALGGMLRAWASRAGLRHVGETLPWGTLGANYTAALVLGALTGAAASDAHGLFWAFAATGALGGLSTVSSLAQQTLGLWQQPRRRAAAVYLLLSVGGGIALAAAGYGLFSKGVG